MVHGTTWIDFSYKPPISAVEGRPRPNDFTIIVAMKDEDRVKYEVMSAKLAMTLYTSGHNLLAWRILDPYTPHETR